MIMRNRVIQALRKIQASTKYKVSEIVTIEYVVDTDDEDEAEEKAREDLPDYKGWDLVSSEGITVEKMAESKHKASEIVTIEYEVDAENEDEARDKAMGDLPDYKGWDLVSSEGVDIEEV